MLNKEINEILKNEVALKHSYFQLEYFVIGNEPTNQSKIRQCIIEIRSRKTDIDNINLELEELQDKKILLELQLDNIKENKKVKAKEKEVRVRMTNRKIQSIDNKIIELEEVQRNKVDECNFLASLFKHLIKIEPIREWEDPDVQKEYWDAKLLHEFRIRLLLGNNIDTELAKTIMALPDDTKVKNGIINLLNHRSSKSITEKPIDNSK